MNPGGRKMRAKNFKILLILIGFMLLVGPACDMLLPSDPTATPFVPPTQSVVEVLPPPTEEVIPEPIATITDTEPPIQMPTETESFIPTETQEIVEVVDDKPPAYFTEEFDSDINDWSYFLMNGDENKMDLYPDYGRLIFDLQGEYQYVYVIYDPYFYSDVMIEAKAENLGKNTNNVSLICQYSERFGWYEFNITNGGMYYIMAYSEMDEGYRTLISGGSTNIKIGRDVNIYTAVCQGNYLALYINGKLENETYDRYYNFKEGQVGISVSSFEVLPILVEIDYFDISLP
jgi:hypothetical protein